MDTAQPLSTDTDSTDIDHLTPANAELINDLVTANHILYAQGVLDAFGHVSVRHPENPKRYLLCRNMAPGQVAAEDIIQYDLDSRPLDANGRKVYLERFIHGEIYKARPDVMAIVHSHSPSVVPFSVVRTAPLRPVCHMAGFLGIGAPIFEISDEIGDGSNLLITDPPLGKALARTLDKKTLVLMRGHGSTVVADDLKKVVYRAVYAEINAKTQLQALQLGQPRYLSEKEAAAATETIETQVIRAWNLWKQRANEVN
ncbi:MULTISPECIES: class II aldolase/adducin family protein [unclassified Pusillimonas]|uniref:class II aldolase/adducin family protein n=1 Tax=unclassified Pusillimonas TaxID=2640016 RepID=UPI000B9C92CD|nr:MULTISPECIES: class II aldolase/adducin family protein [unclassified Pusillimonas]OXR48861.1 aldolase [Pusillimonas sp. T2]ROT45711.1 aldolase [Pusillimonas sp. NJUB218]